MKRTRRDLNPRAAINDLHPFQGCPFSLLGTSAKSRCLNISKYYIVIGKPFACPTERVGFEPTRPCGQTVFKTASLWPLRYLSSNVLCYFTKAFRFCQELFWSFFIVCFEAFRSSHATLMNFSTVSLCCQPCFWHFFHFFFSLLPKLWLRLEKVQIKQAIPASVSL